MRLIFFRPIIAAACTIYCQSLAAQSTSGTATTLEPVVVTGNPLGSRSPLQASEQLNGKELLLRQQPTLGETLNGLPGVSSTYFGPNASRPVIRGLDSDRIQILQNSGSTFDASGLSYDHAVPIDPIAIDSVEVLRGPSAVLYGGSAIGGVVNVIDRRIPREPDAGFYSRANLSLDSASRARSGALALGSSNQSLGWHADGFARTQSQTAVPLDLPCHINGSVVIAKRICNSMLHAQGGAVGVGAFGTGFRIGVGLNTYQSEYGSVSEDAVTLNVRSTRLALEGESDIKTAGLEKIKWQVSKTRYRHEEIEQQKIGTVFNNIGTDFRLEAKLSPMGQWQGVVGLQWDQNRFSALGDEAFVPSTKTRAQAVFVYQERALDWGKLHAAARTEQVSVQSSSNDDEKFVSAKRQFSPLSASVGVQVNISGQLQLNSNLSLTQRAPKDYELFANGAHLATKAYERGNAQLKQEQATGLDVGAQYRQGSTQANVNVFITQFSRFLFLSDTGSTQGELPLFEYRSIPARFMGLETGLKHRLIDSDWKPQIEARADWVRARNTDTNQAVARVAPLRLGFGVSVNPALLQARVGWDYTRGSGTQANASLSYSLKWATTDMLVYLRLNNATNQLGYSATSILTQTAPGRVPLPGRSILLGLQVQL
jgi:iron complex outermembrane recepter protein